MIKIIFTAFNCLHCCMLTGKLKPTTVEEYIAAEPRPEVQQRLHALAGCIRKAAPGAEEALKWNMPAFSYKRILVTFKVYKNHIGLYPTSQVVKALAKELTGYTTGDASIQFPMNEPLPLNLITKIVKLRVKQIKEEDALWKG